MSKNYIAQILEAKDSVFLTHMKHQNRFNDERKEALLRIKKSDSSEENKSINSQTDKRDYDPTIKYKTTINDSINSRNSRHEYSDEMSILKPKSELFESDRQVNQSDSVGSINKSISKNNAPTSIEAILEDVSDDVSSGGDSAGCASSSGDSKASSLTRSSRKLSCEVKALRERLATARRLRTSIDSVIANIPSNAKGGIVNVTKDDVHEEEVNEEPCIAPVLVAAPVDLIISTHSDSLPVSEVEDVIQYQHVNNLNVENSESEMDDVSVTSEDLSFGKQQVDRRAQSLITAHQTKLAWFKRFVSEMEVKYEQASCEAEISVKEASLRHRDKSGRMREEQLQLVENLECVMGELRIKQRRLNEEHAEEIGLLRLKYGRSSAKIEQAIFDIEVKFRADRHLRQKLAEEQGVHLSKQHIEDMYSFKYDHSKQLNELHSELLKVKEESADAQADEVKNHRQSRRELESLTSEARQTVSTRIESVKEEMKVCEDEFKEEVRVIEQGVTDIYEELTEAVSAMTHTQTTMRSELDDAIGSLKHVYERTCGSIGPSSEIGDGSDTAYDDDKMRDRRAAHDMERTWGFSPVPMAKASEVTVVKSPLQRPWAISRRSNLNDQFERLVNNRSPTKLTTPPRRAAIDVDTSKTLPLVKPGSLF